MRYYAQKVPSNTPPGQWAAAFAAKARKALRCEAKKADGRRCSRTGNPQFPNHCLCIQHGRIHINRKASRARLGETPKP